MNYADQLELYEDLWGLLYLALWLISMSFGPIIAKRRGRSGFNWFALSFLFSFLALMVLYYLPNLNEEEDRNHRTTDLEKENYALHFKAAITEGEEV